MGYWHGATEERREVCLDSDLRWLLDKFTVKLGVLCPSPKWGYNTALILTAVSQFLESSIFSLLIRILN